jgi:hypothetical protein
VQGWEYSDPARILYDGFVVPERDTRRNSPAELGWLSEGVIIESRLGTTAGAPQILASRVRCPECHGRVRAHGVGRDGMAAHFEHYENNPAGRLLCPLRLASTLRLLRNVISRIVALMSAGLSPAASFSYTIIGPQFRRW